MRSWELARGMRDQGDIAEYFVISLQRILDRIQQRNPEVAGGKEIITAATAAKLL